MIREPRKTDKIRALATHAQWFEDHLPIDPKYRKPVVQGVSAQAIEVVVEAGDAGPVTPIGVNLPNDQRIRVQFGSKSVTLSNVLDAYERSMPDSFRQEFAWDDAEVERAKRWGAFAGELTTEIHEVLGRMDRADGISRHRHAAGSAQGANSALEETRADLVGVDLWRSVLSQIGMVPPTSSRRGQNEYEALARNALVQLRPRRVGSQLEEDHMRIARRSSIGCS